MLKKRKLPSDTKPKTIKNPKQSGAPIFPYSHDLAEKICLAVSTTHHGLTKICDTHPEFPTPPIIYEWRIKYPHFAEMFMNARRNQADIFAERIIEEATDNSNDTMINDRGNVVINKDHISRSRLIVDSYKWIACKLLPKVYGDKVMNETTVTVKHEEALEELK